MAAILAAIVSITLFTGCFGGGIGLTGSNAARVAGRGISVGDWRAAQEAAAGVETLQELADETVILTAGRREGLVPGDEVIEREIQAIRTWHANDQAYQKALKDYELTETDLRRKLALDLTLEALAMKRVSISPDALSRYFEGNAEEFGRPAAFRYRHIAVANQGDAAEAMARLGHGESFADVARAMSTDLETRSAGGDFGWFARRRPFVRGLFSLTGEPVPTPGFGMPYERVRVITSLPEMSPGQIIGPIPSSFGLSIIQLVETQPAIIPEFEKVREEVKSKYFRVHHRLSALALLWELRQSTAYEISHPEFARLGHEAIIPEWRFTPELLRAVHPSSGAVVPGLDDTLKVWLHSYLGQDFEGLRLVSKSLFWSQLMASEGRLRPRYDRLVKKAEFKFTNSDGISKYTVQLRAVFVEGGMEKPLQAEIEADAFAVAGGVEWKIVRLKEAEGGQ